MVLQEKMVYCTLFDSNYLDKGLALYWSMRKHIKEFKLYIFAFDRKTYEILTDMCLKGAVVLSVEDIMDAALQRLEKERTRAEFCWTCTPLVIKHVLLKYHEKICTYIDADIYFFASPLEVIHEIIDSNCSVGLVAHGFERGYDYGKHLFNEGKYCIQFNTFLNDTNGWRVLENWAECCRDWCYCRIEDGKYGDQKYSDKWKQKYFGVHEVLNKGAGVAPWNLHLYTYLGRHDQQIWMEYERSKFKVVFFHFEGMKYFDKHNIFLNVWKPSNFGTHKKIRDLYGEYLTVTEILRRFLSESYGITFDHLFVERNDFIEKNRFRIRQLCEEHGLFQGIKIWRGYGKNNFVAVNKLVSERMENYVFARKS